MPRVLFVKSRRASFIELDQGLLSEQFEVQELYQPGHVPDLRAVVSGVWRADVVVGWWASWHTLLPFMLARLMRKPSVLIVGGFDTANEPEIGYGYQLGGLRKRLSGWIMRSARVLATNSEYSRGEIQRNVGIAAARVQVVHHGIPDQPDAGTPLHPKERLALTVGIVDIANLQRKGLSLFVAAAAMLPDVRFVVAGRIDGDAGERLQREAGDNVTLTGWLEADQLADVFNRATVYVQASVHEGFGVSVAEAMLARCVPVVTNAGALPEVVGDVGVTVEDRRPDALADGIRRALTLSTGQAARDRVLTSFSVEQRRAGLVSLVERALSGG